MIMNNKYWWWIGGGAIVVAGAGTGAYLLTRARSTTTTTPSSVSASQTQTATATVQLGTTTSTISGSLVNYAMEFAAPSTVVVGQSFGIRVTALKNIRVNGNVDNIPMASQKIAIAIGSSTQTVTTNSQGQATLAASPPAQTGTVTMTAAWQPSGTSQPVTTTATITVVASSQQALCGPKFVATYPATSPTSALYSGFVHAVQSSNPLGLATTYPGCTVRFWWTTYINNANQTFSTIVGLIGVTSTTQARAVMADSGWTNITAMTPVSVNGQTSWVLGA